MRLVYLQITSKKRIDIESNYSDDNASDKRTATSTDNLSGRGTYFYEVEGGTVSGTFSESEYWYEYSSTEISYNKSEESDDWNSTGTYSGESNGDSSSDYDGEGNYSIAETTSEGTRNITGSITESGSTESDYDYSSSGTLSSNGWTMTGSGSENLSEESSYENEESGIYVTEMIDLSGTYIYAYTTETIYYSDEYSVEREVTYSLSDGSWVVSTGSETEEGETTDNFEAETTAYTLASGSEFGTNYYEFTESNYYNEYDVTRTINSSGEWIATSGNSETGEYEKYQSDVMVETASYERTFSQGTMTGKLGWMERELEEFDYDSESEIENGDWVLQSGDGYFVQELSYGNFAKGKYENSNANTTITESWTNLTGTSQRTDYEVENAEWAIEDESETEINTLEYLYNNSASTIPNNYRTIIVDSQTYNDFENYFVINGFYSQDQSEIDDFVTLVESIESFLQTEIRDIRWVLNPNVFGVARAAFTVLAFSNVSLATGEGHHFAPKSVIKELRGEGLLTQGAWEIFMKNTLKPDYYSHALDTWYDVTHVQYSAAVNSILRAYIAEIGIMDVDLAKDFLSWLESGIVKSADGSVPLALKNFVDEKLSTGVLQDAMAKVKTWRDGFFQACSFSEMIVADGVKIGNETIKLTDKKEAKNVIRVLLNSNVSEDIVKTSSGKSVLAKLRNEIAKDSQFLKKLAQKGLSKILPKLIPFTGMLFVAMAARKGFADANGTTFEKAWGALNESAREIMCADLVEGATQPFLNKLETTMNDFFQGSKKTNQLYDLMRELNMPEAENRTYFVLYQSILEEL